MQATAAGVRWYCGKAAAREIKDAVIGVRETASLGGQRGRTKPPAESSLAGSAAEGRPAGLSPSGCEAKVKQHPSECWIQTQGGNSSPAGLA